MDFEMAFCTSFLNNEERIECKQIDDIQYFDCGKIIMSSINFNLNFNCILCTACFSEIEEFHNHIKSLHLNSFMSENNDKLPNTQNQNNDSQIVKFETNEKKEIIDDKEVVLNDIECILKESLEEETIQESFLLDKNEIEEESTKAEDRKICHSVNKKKRIRKKSNVPHLYCNICKKQFTTDKTMEKHKTFCKIVVEHSLVLKSLNACEKDEKIINKIENNQTDTVFAETHDTDPFLCSYCHRRFKDRSTRISHESINHTGVKLYKCDKCDKRFSNKAMLRNHLNVHEGIKPHKCHICSAAFTHLSNLQVHIRRHLGDKRYKCNYCDKKFVANTERRYHERSHTDEKPFQCNECGKCFRTAAFLNTHLQIHAGIKCFKCELCDKSFVTKKRLRNHAVVHKTDKPFECDQCDAKFASRKRLLSHIKIHSDIKSYICTICGKGFKQSPGLYCHMKSHGNSTTKTLKFFVERK